MRAYLFSDDDGDYEFETEWRNLSIPHILFIVTKDGYQVLETQSVGTNKKDRIAFNMILRKIAD